MGWLLNMAYVMLLAAASPLLLWRRFVHRKYREGWHEKLLGRLPYSQPDEQVIWLHAVSVGEVLQLRPIVLRWQKRHPRWTILITTTTSSGLAVAREQFPNCRVTYAPLDFTWAVKTALRRVRPHQVVLVELELWPNLILETTGLGIPLALINGRISEKSYRGYRRLRPLMSQLLRRFDVLAVQSPTYQNRLRNLGAPPNRLHVTGSVKFDGVVGNRDQPVIDRLRSELGVDRCAPVFVAGSTHAPEEQYALQSYLQLKDMSPGLRLILVPRHRERFDEVARMVESLGLPLLRRSETIQQHMPKSVDHSFATSSAASPVLLLDTLGELAACWGLASVAFVGGSLNRRGGQNMIEPAACGAAVIVGPNTQNFLDVVEGLQSAGGILVIPEAGELTRTVRECLANPRDAARMGVAARDFVVSQQGAADRTVKLLEGLTGLGHSAAPDRIAA